METRGMKISFPTSLNEGGRKKEAVVLLWANQCDPTPQPERGVLYGESNKNMENSCRGSFIQKRVDRCCRKRWKEKERKKTTQGGEEKRRGSSGEYEPHEKCMV